VDEELGACDGATFVIDRVNGECWPRPYEPRQIGDRRATYLEDARAVTKDAAQATNGDVIATRNHAGEANQSSGIDVGYK
jgi:hypothetical protein